MAVQDVVLAGFGSGSTVQLIVLAGFGEGAAVADVATTDTSDLMPWDFLREFEVQKKQWLAARTKYEAAKALEKAYESLPPEEAEEIEMPMEVAPAPEVYGTPTITTRIDYDALMASTELVNKLLKRHLELEQQAEEDDMAVLLLSSLH